MDKRRKLVALTVLMLLTLISDQLAAQVDPAKLAASRAREVRPCCHCDQLGPPGMCLRRSRIMR